MKRIKPPWAELALRLRTPPPKRRFFSRKMEGGAQNFGWWDWSVLEISLGTCKWEKAGGLGYGTARYLAIFGFLGVYLEGKFQG